MSIATKLNTLITAKDNIKDAIEDKGIDMTGVPFTEYAEKIAEIQSGGGSVNDSVSGSSLLTGWTMPLTYKNAPTKDRKFFLESIGNITLTGLTGYATVTGNGTNRVEFEITENGSTSLLIPFVITVVSKGKTYNYVGRAFYYGTEPSAGICLAVMSLIMPDDFGAGVLGTNWDIVESTSLPYFSSNTATWNSYYTHQLVSFKMAKNTTTTLSNSFMYYCYAFNQPLDLSSVTSIGGAFMQNCYAFNQPLDLSSLTSVENSFINSCHAFNQPLDLSSLTSVGNYFMYYCYAFNQPLDLSSLTSVGDNFIRYCYAFNQPLDLSSVTSVGDNFMQNCYAFNQPLDLSSLTSVGNYFMYYCYALTLLKWEVNVFPTDDNSLAQNINTKTAASGTGIKIIGTYASGLKSALPNRTSSPFRKLV